MRVQNAAKYMMEWNAKYEQWHSMFLMADNKERESNHKKFKKWHDQASMRRMHKEHYPKIKVDSLCKIFIRNDELMGYL